MKQVAPHRNSFRRVKLIDNRMLPGIRIRRRLILSRFASGGAILGTLLVNLDSRVAQALPFGRGSRRPAPLIILDAGHGGRDPGAIGVTGTQEKDVTLASTLALKAVIRAQGRYRVELTRTSDRYVRREERIEIARDLDASLFISMHADTYSDRSVRGASVYTLARHASDAETEALAERENGVVTGDGGGGGVPEILASLAARETRAASARIAHQLVSDMERALPVLQRPERHANFTVLHAAGIPSVLIEMGFLSNSADEAALNDPGHRDLIARSVTRAIETWFAAPREGGPA
jgi:N-acetylmuramoyl-L-alanine amidase